MLKREKTEIPTESLRKKSERWKRNSA